MINTIILKLSSKLGSENDSQNDLRHTFNRTLNLPGYMKDCFLAMVIHYLKDILIQG